MNLCDCTVLLFTFASVCCSQFGPDGISRRNVDVLENPRYLLYDVNPGEGFNLRRDVYIRLANLVHFLNEAEPWVLVLPPWGGLYHWQSDIVQEKLPWSHFFDIPSLKFHIPVIEFEEFLQLSGGNIDSTFYLQRYKEGWTKWEEKMDKRECLDNTRFKKSETDGRWHWWFWGYSDLVSSAQFECVSVLMSATGFRHFLLKNITASSVLLLRAEQLIHGEYSEWSSLWWTARRSMRFAARLRRIADDFRLAHLNSSDQWDRTVLADSWVTMKRNHGDALGGPYIAVHMRRKDFLHGHKNEVPSIAWAAHQIRDLLTATHLQTVFIATDAPYTEFTELQQHLAEFTVVKFKPSTHQLDELKDGGVAIIDQWICAHARHFIGTYVSTFSFRIQEEREILGFKQETTFNRLCPDNQLTCEQPSKWPIIYE